MNTNYGLRTSCTAANTALFKWSWGFTESLNRSECYKGWTAYTSLVPDIKSSQCHPYCDNQTCRDCKQLHTDGNYKPLTKDPWWCIPHTSYMRLSLMVWDAHGNSFSTHSWHIWRRQWQPTPVLLPGKSHGQRSLVGCSPWGCGESDATGQLHFHFSLSCIGEGNGNPLQCSCLESPRDGGAWWSAIYGVT